MALPNSLQYGFANTGQSHVFVGAKLFRAIECCRDAALVIVRLIGKAGVCQHGVILTNNMLFYSIIFKAKVLFSANNRGTVVSAGYSGGLAG